VLDTGIDVTHQDLNVVRWPPYPVSMVGGDSNDFNDRHGHGTHVAGIAAAKFDEHGTTGVSSGAWVVPVKVFDDDASGFASDILAGLDHIAIYSIWNDVVNMSISIPWGSTCASSTEQVNRAHREAVRNLGFAGVWMVGASGNESDCAGSTYNLPGCVNSFRVLTIGSMECDGSPSFFQIGGLVSIGWRWAAASTLHSSLVLMPALPEHLWLRP
jgi:subtilisin family serine protease